MLPKYVPRQHDGMLADAVQEAAAGRSGMVVLVGTSSTGKTRACWEAVQPLAARGWRLWHPFDPTRAEAALEDLHRVQPCTVVWLNEAQHYLGDPAFGERIAAAVHHLLSAKERAPVLVLGTLWPEYADVYAALPEPGPSESDPHSRARELLSGRRIRVPDTFDQKALASARALARAGDALWADTLSRADGHGRVAQDLAGAPELLRRYEDGSCGARAILDAAMDARRLRVGLHLPQAFLSHAALDYLTDSDYQQLSEDWAEAAYAELTQPVHGKQAPLSRIRPRPQHRPPAPQPPTTAPMTPPAGRLFRLADYLEQHGRTLRRPHCPPASFWHAAHTHLTSGDDLGRLADAARRRHRLQWAHHLSRRAAETGNCDPLLLLARTREKAGDRDGAEALLRQAADHGHVEALTHLAQLRLKARDREGTESLLQQAAHAGHIDALTHLARLREEAGDRQGAETLYRQAADHGSTDVLVYLAQWREEAGDQEGAEALLRQAADHGNTRALVHLAERRENGGDREAAESLLRQAASHGNTRALVHLVDRREEAEDREGAETLARHAAEQGNTDALAHLAERRDWGRDREGAETLARQAADLGDTRALVNLAVLREKGGDRGGAETLARQAADHGNTRALVHLAMRREEAGDREGAETLARQAADHGNTDALVYLARERERVGDPGGAEALARQAADHGNTRALVHLAERRENGGDREAAESLYRQAANHGNADGVYPTEMTRVFQRLWPYGLDPDGTPSPRWP
ncbi:hypothetical protein ACF08B_36225 [Streptomyces sp. NPDC015139]|uniref:SEL1-like repeat protein n=1 Tax=Streptomyces sp. NPDC015139 TaxID=3364942 RepID=UPI0036FE8DEC